MIEVVLNDRLGKKVRVKCNEDDTIGDLKKLVKFCLYGTGNHCLQPKGTVLLRPGLFHGDVFSCPVLLLLIFTYVTPKIIIKNESFRWYISKYDSLGVRYVIIMILGVMYVKIPLFNLGEGIIYLINIALLFMMSQTAVC
ncbi:hypothetical protein IEQ34_019438 [Dendrobium chrysotoxum]|uniref:Ubiquitin-like domain-containing protein n=1 Tax=Dendrobium chrysotoxum TaxID=161865 RepID=A0AAV7G8L4_DENCH|nr:hypothetical protein IEQ34_019438 [Dendrobium chrysotoxum]